VRFGFTNVGRGWEGSRRILIHESFCGSVGGTSKPLFALRFSDRRFLGKERNTYHLNPRAVDDISSLPVLGGRDNDALSLGLPTSLGLAARDIGGAG
jgi:hypothetical protein